MTKPQARRFIADASTLIALATCGKLDLLRKIAKEVFVTEAVQREVLTGGPGTSTVQQALQAGWVKALPSKGQVQGLGPGESSILLAAKPEDILILDDRLARLEAKTRGLRCTGLLGILVHGAQEKTLTRKEAIAALNDLAEGNFRMTSALYRWALDKLQGPP